MYSQGECVQTFYSSSTGKVNWAPNQPIIDTMGKKDIINIKYTTLSPVNESRISGFTDLQIKAMIPTRSIPRETLFFIVIATSGLDK